MCFICPIKKWRIADKPIAVWKIIRNGGIAPYYDNYIYQKGYNKPFEQNAHCTYNPGSDAYEFSWGVLHCFDNNCFTRPPHLRNAKIVRMYIPEGTEYMCNSEGEVIAKELYWPINLIDKIRWHRKSL